MKKSVSQQSSALKADALQSRNKQNQSRLTPLHSSNENTRCIDEIDEIIRMAEKGIRSLKKNDRNLPGQHHTMTSNEIDEIIRMAENGTRSPENNRRTLLMQSHTLVTYECINGSGVNSTSPRKYQRPPQVHFYPTTVQHSIGVAGSVSAPPYGHQETLPDQFLPQPIHKFNCITVEDGKLWEDDREYHFEQFNMLRSIAQADPILRKTDQRLLPSQLIPWQANVPQNSLRHDHLFVLPSRENKAVSIRAPKSVGKANFMPKCPVRESQQRDYKDKLHIKALQIKPSTENAHAVQNVEETMQPLRQVNLCSTQLSVEQTLPKNNSLRTASDSKEFQAHTLTTRERKETANDKKAAMEAALSSKENMHSANKSMLFMEGSEPKASQQDTEAPFMTYLPKYTGLKGDPSRTMLPQTVDTIPQCSSVDFLPPLRRSSSIEDRSYLSDIDALYHKKHQQWNNSLQSALPLESRMMDQKYGYPEGTNGNIQAYTSQSQLYISPEQMFRPISIAANRPQQKRPHSVLQTNFEDVIRTNGYYLDSNDRQQQGPLGQLSSEYNLSDVYTSLHGLGTTIPFMGHFSTFKDIKLSQVDHHNAKPPILGDQNISHNESSLSSETASITVKDPSRHPSSTLSTNPQSDDCPHSYSMETNHEYQQAHALPIQQASNHVSVDEITRLEDTQARNRNSLYLGNRGEIDHLSFGRLEAELLKMVSSDDEESDESRESRVALY